LLVHTQEGSIADELGNRKIPFYPGIRAKHFILSI